MSMTHFPIEKFDGDEHVVKIVLENIQDPQRLTSLLHNSFEICLKKRDFHIILDMQKVHYPTASFIALLVEATSRLRRVNGDVKLINLRQSARNNLATFSPISFLSVEGDEAYALQEFRKITNNKVAPQPEATPPPATPVDIVDEPIIEKIQDSIKESIKKAKTGEKPHPRPRVQPAPQVDTETPDKYHLRVKSETKNLYSICDFVVDIAAKAGLDPKQLGKTKIAVYEACLNVIEHAYHSKPGNWIDVWVGYDSSRMTIEIKDYGLGFEGFDEKNYDVLSAMDGRQTGGFGLYIIKRSMDELYYKPDAVSGNLLTMVKYLKTSA